MMLEAFNQVECQDGVDCYLIGGFIDDKGHAVDISHYILNFLHSSDVRFHLRLCCINSLNSNSSSDESPFPYITSLVMSSDGTVLPATFSIDSKGPDQDLRGGLFTTRDVFLQNVYDIEQDCYLIEPFKYEPFDTDAILYLLSLDDQGLTDMTSTTPDAEGPDYVVQLRGVLRFWLRNMDPVKFFKGRSRLHRWDASRTCWMMDNK